jgi:hypothetical protein
MTKILKSFDVNNYGDLNLWTYFPTPEEALVAGKQIEAMQQASWDAYWADVEATALLAKSEEAPVETPVETEEAPVEFIKSMDVEKQLFTAVVLRPEVVDAHGDIYAHDVVENAAMDYMLKSQAGNVQHMFNTDEMAVVESYIAKSDALDGGILEGDWVMTMFVKDAGLWDMCKAGEFTGFSVGCMGTVVEL